MADPADYAHRPPDADTAYGPSDRMSPGASSPARPRPATDRDSDDDRAPRLGIPVGQRF